MATFRIHTNRQLPTRSTRTVGDVQQQFRSDLALTREATAAAVSAANWYDNYQYKKDATLFTSEAVNQQAEHERNLVGIRQSGEVDPATGETSYTYKGQKFKSAAEAELIAKQEYIQNRQAAIGQIGNKRLREGAQSALDKEVQSFNENEAKRLMAEADFELVRSVGKAHVNLLRGGNYDQARVALDEAEATGTITREERKRIETNGEQLVVDDLMASYEAAVRGGTGDEFILDVMDDSSYPMSIRKTFASQATGWAITNASTVARIEAEHAAEQAELNAEFTKRFYEDLHANRASISGVEEAFDRGIINENQRGNYIAKINEHNLAQQQMFTDVATVRTVVAGAGQFGSVPATTENKEKFNTAYGVELQEGKDPFEMGKAYTRAGIIPEQYNHLLTTGLTANNPEMVAQNAFAVFDLLTDPDTRDIASQQLPSQAKAKATAIAKSIRAGVNQADALAAWNNKQELMNMEDSPYLKEIAEDKTKLPDRDKYLSGMHSPGLIARWFGGAEKFDVIQVPIGERESAYSDMMTRYDAYRHLGSDHDEALELAQQESPYRATKVNGREEIAAYSLEAFHGQEAVDEWNAEKPEGAILAHDPMLGGTEYPILFKTEYGLQGQFDENGARLVFQPSGKTPETVAEQERQGAKTREQLIEEREQRERIANLPSGQRRRESRGTRELEERVAGPVPSGQRRRQRREEGRAPEVERMAKF